jgi:hypothetical protein
LVVAAARDRAGENIKHCVEHKHKGRVWYTRPATSRNTASRCRRASFRAVEAAAHLGQQGQLYRLRSERASHHARLNDRTHSVEEIIFRRPMIPSLRRSGIRQKKATTDIPLDCHTATILRCASQRNRTHSQLTKPRFRSFGFPHNQLIGRCAMMAEHDFLQVTPPWRRRT